MCFSASYVFLFSTSGVETTYNTHVLKRKISSPTFPCLFSPFLSSSPSSPPPSHGLGELLAIWMLALHCEHSLIASVLPTASRASQHGAPAVCLICHCSVDIHCEKTEEKWRERLREGGNIYKRLSKLLEASGRIICFLSLSLALSSLFFSQPETINGVLNQTSLVLK